MRSVISSGEIAREQIVVCTKGGYIPLERTPPATKEGYRGFLHSEYYGPGIMGPDDVVSGGHCLAPRYLDDQIERSRKNLGLGSIDIYYLHNPEQQLDVLSRPDFLNVMRSAFAALENQVRRGVIGNYGCATWNGFRVLPEARNHLSLQELVTVAREAGGEQHHFKVVQLPVNLAMTEAGGCRPKPLDRSHAVSRGGPRLGISIVGVRLLCNPNWPSRCPSSSIPLFPASARMLVAR